MPRSSEIPPILAPFKAIFFDIDGTLVDSNEFHVLAWDEAFRQNGHSIPRALLRKQIGKGADVLIPALLPEASKAHQLEISDAHSRIFKSRYLSQVKPFPGAADLVRALHANGRSVLLVSSSDEKEVEHYAKLLDIESSLDGTVRFDDVERTKPAGDLFHVALRKSGVDAEGAVAVGDTPYDIEAASKCGIQTVALRSGGFADEELSAIASLGLFTDIGTLLGSAHGAKGVRH